ncbi:MAG: SDR family NAD(P)-dependent oxidoreductase [bacterium]|nr:SDR family NAD(P)-dependent oxidoreductase [bacterium]
MKKRKIALVTGVAGFVGSWLAEELLDHGYTVYGSALANEPLDNIAQIKREVRLAQLDITNPTQCNRVLKRINPDYLFHLAAFSSVGQSFQHERATYKINFDGTLNMLEAASGLSRLKKFLFTSSADCYGSFQPVNKTLREEQPLNPISPYAISKVAAEHACRLYSRQGRIPVVISRSFNHAGPRQNENFVIPSFSLQIAAIEAGKQKPVMQVGGLTARRDICDVRDIVRGYRLMATKGKAGEIYQLCSGKTLSIEQILAHLLAQAEVRIEVQTDKSRIRKNDIPILRGSNRKAVQELGFQSRYKINRTLKDTLDYFREKSARLS